MGATVNVNNMTVVHKGSGGISIAFPDVCKTPAPPAPPVPIPYPNVAKSSDTSKGSKKVKMDGNPIMLKDSVFSMSTGDEAGSAGGGIISSKIKGKAKFTVYSFDVKVEGKAVPRLLDPMFQNEGSPAQSASPAELQGPQVLVDMSKVGKTKEEACEKLEEKRVKDHDKAAEKAGMRVDDYEAIRDVCADNNALVSFRSTNKACLPHIGKMRSKTMSISKKGIKSGLDGKVSVGGKTYTGDYDMHDMITSSSGNRVRGGSAKEKKLIRRMNKAMKKGPYGGTFGRIKHGAHANYGDYLKKHPGIKPERQYLKPDVSKEKPLTVFDGKSKPATVYQLESNEDLVNMYRCKGTDMPEEWDIRDKATGEKIGAKIK